MITRVVGTVGRTVLVVTRDTADAGDVRVRRTKAGAWKCDQHGHQPEPLCAHAVAAAGALERHAAVRKSMGRRTA